MNFFKKIRQFFEGSKERTSKYGSPDVTLTNPYIDSEAISSLSVASRKLESELGMKSTGRCGICVKDVSVQSFHEMKKYIENFLGIASDKKNENRISFSFESLLDEYNYLWFILKGNSIEDLLTGINAIGDTVHEKGFSRQILAAVFEYTSGYTNKSSYDDPTFALTDQNKYQYLIYNYKRDNFYPFVPAIPKIDDKRKRDNNMEVKIMEEISNDIPFEKDLSQWYPIWNIPFNHL
ncbi:MAG: hypothetical protein MRJ93_07385 [Nitrososphaeraceae archaeon]|nr:hypothetical protein [Nitrososphaeraceae archaeon]